MPTVSPTWVVMELGAGQILTYPNPMKGKTLWFYYHCHAPARVTIDIVNVTGEKIARLEDAPVIPGIVRTSWDASRLAPGIYLYRAHIEDTEGTRDFSWQKFVVVR